MKNTAFIPTDIYLPQNVDMSKWSVIACDQFTEQRAYWDKLTEFVGDAPSTLALILPEAYLEDSDVPQRIQNANETMKQYLENGVLRRFENAMIYVERTLSDGSLRRGLVGALDLEEYSFSADAATLCRPTEQTVPSRIPPRKKLREGASLELPHAMMLLDDKEGSVIEAVGAAKETMTCVYDFDLPMDSGHVTGYLLNEALCQQVQNALLALKEQSVQKYGSALLYLVGDGNHSIATAKSCYEDIKEAAHPARRCLVELCNLHDESLQFEPIHRVLFGADQGDLLNALQAAHPAEEGDQQSVTLLTATERRDIPLGRPSAKLSVGTLQQFLDEYMSTHPEVTIDYVHEESSLMECAERGGIGLMLPAMDKDRLFESVLCDGVLPRKTFSMGHAADKRFYLECRKIVK